jgi:ribosome-binding factor A
MKFFRAERVSKLLKEHISELIVREVEFKNALVTVTDVEVDKKLDHAKVKISVIPADRALAAIHELDKQASHLQYLLLKKINIKPMPRIAFAVDHGYENAAQVEKRLMGK